MLRPPLRTGGLLGARPGWASHVHGLLSGVAGRSYSWREVVSRAGLWAVWPWARGRRQLTRGTCWVCCVSVCDVCLCEVCLCVVCVCKVCVWCVLCVVCELSVCEVSVVCLYATCVLCVCI